MSKPFVLPKQVPLNSAGNAYPGAKAYFFETGTTTPKDTYSDAGLTTPHAHPVVADGGGTFPAIYLGDGDYKLTLNTSADVLIYTTDPLGDFTPSGEDIGEQLFPRTAREIAASVTPTTFVYPEFDSRRYSTLAQMISVMGDTTTMRAAKATIRGTNTQTATLLIERKTAVFEGEGPGSVSAGSGTVVASSGLSGSPLVNIEQCWGLTLRDMRFKGQSSSKPSAAVKLTSTGGDNPYNTQIAIEHCWIGSYGGFDSDNATQFDVGVLVDGTNTQEDQSCLRHMTIQGCTTSCIHFAQNQNVFWELDTITLNSATYGVRINTRNVNARNIFAQTCSTADWYLDGDGTLDVVAYGSELGGRMLLADDGYMVSFRNFYFQLRTNSVVASGNIIDCASATNGSLVLEDGAFTQEGGYAGATPKLKLRGANVCLYMRNVFLPNAIDTFLDLATVNAGDKRMIILIDVVDSTGAVFNGRAYWKHGEVAPTFSTMLGQQDRPVFTSNGTWDIGNTANGANAQQNFTVTGARLGDHALHPGKSLALSGWNLNAEVVASDTVRVTAVNNTGGADDPASQTIYLEVKQRTS